MFSSAFAQTAAGAATPMSTWQSFLPLILMFVVLYFLMIRPQMKKQKEHKAMVDALAVGDEVIVGGGLYGRITKVADALVHVEIATGVDVQMQRGSVVTVLPKGTLKK